MGTDVEGAASFSSLPKVVSNEGDPQTGAAEAPNTGSLHPASGAGEDSEFKRILDELRSLRKDRIDMRGELEKLAQEEKRLRDTLVAGGISVPMGHITASGNVFANNGNLSGSQEGKTGSMPHSHPPSQPYLHQVHPHAHAQAPHHPSHHLRHQYYAPTSELSGSKLVGTSLEQMRLMNGDERDRENRRTNTAAPMLPSYLSNTSPSPQPSAMHHGISSFPSGGLSNVAPTHATMSSMWGQLSQFNVFEDNFSRVPSHHTAVHHAHAQPSQQPHHARHLQHRHLHHTRHNHLHQQFPVGGLHPAAYGIQYPGSAQPQLVPSYTPGNKTAFGTALGHVTVSAAPGPSTSEWALNPSGNVISSHPDTAAGMVPFHSTHPRIGFESHAPPLPIVSPSAYTQQQQVGADAAARTDVNPSSTYPSQLPCFLEDRDMGGYSQPYPPSKSSHNSGGGTYPTEHSSNTPTPLPVPLSPFAHHPFPPQSIFGSAPPHHHLSPYPNMPVTQGMPFGSGTSGAESSHPSPGVSALRSPDLTPHAQAASIAAVHHTFPSTSVSNTLNSTNNNNGGLGGNNKRGVALQGTVFDTSGDVSSTALHGTCGVDPTYPAMTGGSPHSVLGHIVLLAQDQNGCRMLQRTFAESTKSERFLILEEIRAAGALGRLMMDPFANFFVQKMCESASDEELTELLRMSQAELASVCFSVYGTRTVQKMIETLRTQENVELFQEGLRPHVVALVKDTNSNHVIQKCLCTFSHPNKQFIFDAMVPRLVEVATNRYGCCVLQRCLDHGDTEQRNALIPHIIGYALHLVQDSFGNYLIQYLVNMKDSNLIAKIIRPLLHRIAPLSCSKYASNVIEKCLRVAPEGIRQLLVDELTYPEHVPQLLRDGFANYVLQTALVVASPLQFEQLAEAIQPSLHLVRNLPHGKKLESKLTRRQQQVSLAQKKGVSEGSVTRSDARGAEAESASNPKGSRKKRVSPQ